MITSTSANIGVVLREALTLAIGLRERQETVMQSQITDPDEEARQQDRFERSFCQLGVFPQCKGIRIA